MNYDLEPGDLERAIVNKLVKHRDMTGYEYGIFVALYTDAGKKYSRRQLSDLLGADRKAIGLAITRLEQRGLLRCVGQSIKLVNILADLKDLFPK